MTALTLAPSTASASAFTYYPESVKAWFNTQDDIQITSELTRALERTHSVIVSVRVCAACVPARFVAVAYRPGGVCYVRRSDSFRLALELLDAALAAVVS